MIENGNSQHANGNGHHANGNGTGNGYRFGTALTG